MLVEDSRVLQLRSSFVFKSARDALEYKCICRFKFMLSELKKLGEKVLSINLLGIPGIPYEC
ncbi:MAG: hypothetical protein QW320_12060, partial [Ignisphaera sp.]